MHKITFSIIAFSLLFLILTSCKKDELVELNKPEWISVLDDKDITSTDVEVYAGRNGKVVLDANENIYLYYYSDKSKRTTLVKCDPLGNVLWRRQFELFAASDMVSLGDGRIIIIGADPTYAIYGYTIFQITEENKQQVQSFYPNPAYNTRTHENASLHALGDNSVIISGSSAWEGLVIFPQRNKHFFAKLNSNFQIEWDVHFRYFDYPSMGTYYEYWMQNSTHVTSNNQILFEYSIETNPSVDNENYFGLRTGLLNMDGSFDTSYFVESGYYLQTSGEARGVKNRYSDAIISDKTGRFIFHYSNPTVFGETPDVPSGFIEIGEDAKIKDTIPIPLPLGYRIVSFNISNDRFLLSAYKSGIVDGTLDFTANQTLFLTGGLDLISTRQFSFQNFSADYFTSIAPTNDGGFLILGKIQSFNGPDNKIVLIKYKE